jgi:hypothetical protein
MSRTGAEPPRPGLTARGVVAAVFLVAPFVGLLWVSSYAKRGPELWGFPFFYWYQFLWVFLAAGLTYSAYRLLPRRRRPSDPADTPGGRR